MNVAEETLRKIGVVFEFLEETRLDNGIALLKHSIKQLNGLINSKPRLGLMNLRYSKSSHTTIII